MSVARFGAHTPGRGHHHPQARSTALNDGSVPEGFSWEDRWLMTRKRACGDVGAVTALPSLCYSGHVWPAPSPRWLSGFNWGGWVTGGTAAKLVQQGRTNLA